MKIYALYDSVRKKYFRITFSEKKRFTDTPQQLFGSRIECEQIAKRMTRYWKDWNYTDETPKFTIKEFEIQL
jgi:hypothetical protein